MTDHTTTLETVCAHPRWAYVRYFVSREVVVEDIEADLPVVSSPNISDEYLDFECVGGGG